MTLVRVQRVGEEFAPVPPPIDDGSGWPLALVPASGSGAPMPVLGADDGFVAAAAAAIVESDAWVVPPWVAPSPAAWALGLDVEWAPQPPAFDSEAWAAPSCVLPLPVQSPLWLEDGWSPAPATGLGADDSWTPPRSVTPTRRFELDPWLLDAGEVHGTVAATAIDSDDGWWATWLLQLRSAPPTVSLGFGTLTLMEFAPTIAPPPVVPGFYFVVSFTPGMPIVAARGGSPAVSARAGFPIATFRLAGDT